MAWTFLAVFVLFVLPVTAIGTLLMFIRGTRDWKTWCSSTGTIIVVYLAGVATAYVMTQDSNTARQAKAKPLAVPPVVASNSPAKGTEPLIQGQSQPEPKPAPTTVTPQSPPSAPVQPQSTVEQPASKPTPPTTEPSAPVTSPDPVPSPAPTQPPATQPPATQPSSPPQPPTTQPPTSTTQPNPTPSQPPVPAKGPNGESIKGSTNAQGEKVYYLLGSPSFDKAAAERWFKSEDDAKKAGYKLAP